jgi:hypothetical protein
MLYYLQYHITVMMIMLSDNKFKLVANNNNNNNNNNNKIPRLKITYNTYIIEFLRSRCRSCDLASN